MDATLAQRIIDYEDGTLGEGEQLQLFAELIRSGLAWKLQGHYGRMAARLIDAGCISRSGVILYN